MNMISRVNRRSIIPIYKKMLRDRGISNYHFLPEWVVHDSLDKKDPIMTLGMLMDIDWGKWNPKPGTVLSHQFDYRNEYAAYNVTMMKKDTGVCEIYITEMVLEIYPRTKQVYLATTDYYGELCDELNKSLYILDKPIYRNPGANGKWHDNRDLI